MIRAVFQHQGRDGKRPRPREVYGIMKRHRGSASSRERNRTPAPRFAALSCAAASLREAPCPLPRRLRGGGFCSSKTMMTGASSSLVLQSHGHHVESVATLGEGLARSTLPGESFEVLISDIGLP